jgi:L-fucose isomerase-like protein
MNLQIGFVALARSTFDMALAAEVTDAARARLGEAGLTLCGTTQLISDLPGTERAIEALAGERIDLLAIYQATFADSTLAVRLAEAIDAPVLLWAVPEARTGGRLRLNSLCGINLAGHALALRGRTYDYVYADPNDAHAVARVKAIAQAGQVKRLLSQARLGVAGEHPTGFDSCHLDASQLRETLGVQVTQMDLACVFDRVRHVDRSALSSARTRLDVTLDNLATLDQTPLNGTLGVYAALKQMAQDSGCDALAVRCWPEFFTELGCAACGAMALMNTDGVPCGCEADANGALTQLILQWLSGEPAFGADVVEFNAGENSAVLWHCGQAPLTMADPETKTQGGIHSNRKLPLVMEFPLKPGRVTIARLSRARDGALRLVIGRGEMLRAPNSFSGTSGVIRFERPAMDVLDTIMREGLEHHIAIAYGDHQASLEALARMLKLELVRL